MQKPIRLLMFFAGLLLILGLPGCTSSNILPSAPSPTPPWLVPVAPVFRDLFQKLGGESVLGAAVVEAAARSDGITCQILEKVVMCYNPNASEVDRIYLASIGYEVLGIPQKPPSPEIRVYDPFLPIYRDRFFGARYVGKPLTEVRINISRTHLTQYFEKMAFSQALNDPKAEIQLLPYGTTLYRRNNPGAKLPIGSSIISAQDTEIPSISSITRLGGFETIGSPLSKPYPAKETGSEQLFENVLAFIPKENPNTVRLRDLTLRVGIIPTPPVAQLYSLEDNMVFYKTKGNLGYHVPIYFDQFIAIHGGLELSGNPIGEPAVLEVNGKVIARQCFQNYCLDYDRTPPDGIHVRIAAIGKLYLNQVKAEYKPFILSAQTISLRITKAQTKISNTQELTIEVLVQQTQGGKPLLDVEGFILLNQADGTRLSFNLPPTNTSGKTHVVLPPLRNAANAQIIPYIVCLNLPTEQPVCSTDSFIIWNLK